MKLALVLIAFLQFVPAADSPRELHFASGIAIIEPQGNIEHVVIEDPDGIIASDSYCDAQTGKYDDIVKLGQSIRTAATVSDKALMASLVRYPLRVNVPSVVRGVRTVHDIYAQNKGDLVANYSTFITQHVTDLLRQIEPHDVFCKLGMSTISGGLIWATVDRDGILKLAVINQ